jgi:hypothetical protein
MRPGLSIPLTREQVADRCRFASEHQATDWQKIIFTDESWSIFGARISVWRRRADAGREMCCFKGKFRLKVMLFGGIAKDSKSAVIIAESGTVNAESDVDHFLDQSGIIPEMNQWYSPYHWR